MMPFHDPADARAAFIALGKAFYARGAAAATSGNYSARLGDGSILVTRSGLHKGRLDDDSFMRIDVQGHALEPGRASAEAALHLMLYRLFPDCGAVLHCHSPVAVGFSRAIADMDHWTFTGHEMLKAYPGVATHDLSRTLPVVANSQQMAEVKASVEPRLLAADAVPAFLIRGHGLYAWGANIEEAERVLEATEWLIAAELAERTFVMKGSA